MNVRLEQHGNDVLIWVKSVPNASRDEIADPRGDRLKVRVRAAAEAGKANKAICKLLAKAVNVKTNQVTVESGHSNPEKIIRLAAMTIDEVRQLLA